MPHKLIGQVVTMVHPVIVKPGFRRMTDENEPVEVPAKVEMVEQEAYVIGVEPRYNEAGLPISPGLHLAYYNPEKAHLLSGSGWREAFDRKDSVKPASHGDIDRSSDDPQQPHYLSEEVEIELYEQRKAKRAAQPVGFGVIDGREGTFDRPIGRGASVPHGDHRPDSPYPAASFEEKLLPPEVSRVEAAHKIAADQEKRAAEKKAETPVGFGK